MNNPTILWAQDREKIFITLEILNLTSQNISFLEKQIKFVGKNETQDYEVVIDLHGEINSGNSEWQVKSTGVKITLEKSSRKFWNRLTLNKQNNVKIDWQKWVNEDDSDESDENESLVQNFNDFKKTLPSELLEKDFTELLPDNNEDLDPDEPDEILANENLTELNNLDDGFLGGGEESYTDNSNEVIQIQDSDGTLVVDELDLDKLENDIVEDLAELKE